MKTIARLIAMITMTAPLISMADNIIRAQAPIAPSHIGNIGDAWVAYESSYTEWTSFGSPSCQITPGNGEVGLGAFSQSKVCSLMMSRNRQDRQFNTISKVLRDFGVAVTEYKLVPGETSFYRSGECAFSMELGTSEANWQMRMKDGVDYTNAVTWSGNAFIGVWSPSVEMTIFGNTYFRGKLGVREDWDNSVYYATCKVNP